MSGLKINVMKIYPIINTVKNYSKALVLAGGLAITPATVKAERFMADTFSMTQQVTKTLTQVPHEGSTDSLILANAPSCDIIIQGVKKKAKIVVDVANHLLYKYSSDGKPEIVYPVATGKPETPTHKGVRRVSHIEIPRLRRAPKHTKRYKNPAPFGARCIILDIIDLETGKLTRIGEFIHGNNAPESIGLDASGGCVRMPEGAVIEVSKDVKSGDIVIIK